MKIKLTDYLLETCEKYKDNVAVTEGEKKITFGELLCAVKRVAGGIFNMTPRARIVAVFIPKSIELVVSDLAITYMGATFVNIDVNLPEKRLNAILNNVAPDIIITLENNVEKIKGLGYEGVSVAQLMKNEEILYQNVWRDVIDTDPFCIINTSGSTGTPKAVVLNHRSFIDFCEWSVETFDFSHRTVMGSLSPAVFDIFIFELCMLCYKGAQIVILDAKLAILPSKLLEQLKDKDVNFIFWVPTVMVNIANADLLSKIQLDKLSLIWFAGEVFPTKQFNYWYSKLPDTKFVNMYGPIEITLDCTYYIVDRVYRDDEPLPIGKACRNTDILILNEKDEECGIDEDGELCVRGTSLAMGYYNDSEKTALAFTQNPLNTKYPEIIYRTGDIVSKSANGLIYIKGRKDHIVKHRGYRIDLLEIEHILINKMHAVKNCCAVYDYADKRILLFYEGEKLPEEVFKIRKEMADFVPNYMVPGKWYGMKHLPMNTNGKIDRQWLTNHIEDWSR